MPVTLITLKIPVFNLLLTNSYLRSYSSTIMKSISLSILAIVSALFAHMPVLQAQTVVPTQTDEIIINPNGNTRAEPGEQIRYKVTIQNTGAANATGTQLNIVPDPRTTFVPGTFRSSPLALPDAYTCTGNVGLNVPAASGLKANDFDDNTAGLTVTAGTFATSQGGSIMVVADGGFMYSPPAGFNGTDTYTYTLNDGNGIGGGVPATDVTTVTITVSNLIWFIDNSSAAATSDGRLSSPFKSLADFNAGSSTAASVIYIEHTGTNYNGGIVLQNNEQLFGEGHTGGANLANVLPFTLAPNSKTLPAINGSRPVITNSGGDGVTLAMNNTLRGFNVGNCMDFGVDNAGTSSVGNLVVSEVTISNTTGGGLDAGNGSGAGMNAAFDAISSTGGANGINLTNCAGTFTVNGGTITNPSGTGILVSGGSVNITCAAAVSDNTGFAVDVDNHDSGNATFSGNITSTAQGIRVQNCGGGTKTFSGVSKSITTGVNAGVTLASNAGATIALSNGGLVISSTTGVGFNATGGAASVTVTGSGNTITSTSAAALNVNSTTIGSGNLVFQSISSGNNDASADPANGIVLNTTGTQGGLVVTGTGTSGSGGTIQRTTSHGIFLSSTTGPSFNNMIVTTTARSGVQGTAVVNFTFTNGMIEYSGVNSSGTITGILNDSNIAFNDGSIGTPTTLEQSLTGNVTITGNTLNNGYYGGVDIFNYNGTISDANISGNNFTSGGNATISQGTAIRLIVSGGASNTANLARATIDNNVITGFPSGAGIVVSGNNAASTAPGSTMGIPNSMTDIISIQNNRIAGFSLATRLSTNAIVFNINGGNPASRSRANINVSNNGTAANPLAFIGGNVISVSVFGNATATAAVNNNYISPDNSVGSQGIGGGIGRTMVNTDTPDLTITVNNNNISKTDGNGILLVAREANGIMKATIKNNNVAAPLSGVRPGIRVDCGGSSGLDDAICLDIQNNVSAGSGDPATTQAPGIGLRKQGTDPNINSLSIEGLMATSTPGVENYVNSLNPGSASGGPSGGGVGGTLLISATSGFTNCSSAP